MLNLIRKTGALNTDEPQDQIAEPRLVQPESVTMVQACDAGLFIKQIQVGQTVNEGEKIGDLIDPVAGQVLEEVRSPCTGMVFTLREHPLTLKGAPLARIATEEGDFA